MLNIHQVKRECPIGSPSMAIVSIPLPRGIYSSTHSLSVINLGHIYLG